MLRRYFVRKQASRDGGITLEQPRQRRAANNTEIGTAGVLAWAAPLSAFCSTVPLWADTALSEAGQVQRPIKVSILFISDIFLLPVVRSRVNKGVEGRAINLNLHCDLLSLASHWKNRSGVPLLDHHKLTSIWQPFWAVLQQKLASCC